MTPKVGNVSKIAWSGLGFFFLAALGLVLNSMIAQRFGAQGLGIFNQVFAMVIVVTQFSTFGLHYFVLYRVGNEFEGSYVQDFFSTLSLCLLTVGSCLVALFVLEPAIALLFKSPEFLSSLRYAYFGIAFFSLNKILFSYLNAKNWFRSFAAFQGLRILTYVLAFFYLSQLNHPLEKMGVLFSVGEAALFFPVLVFALRKGGLRWTQPSRQSLRSAGLFGFNSFINGAMLELNSRVDILCLGFYLRDDQVGIYSVALFVFEGIAQIFPALRAVLTPSLGMAFIRKNKALFDETLQYFLRRSYLVGICAALGAGLLYTVVGQLFFEIDLLERSYLSVGILLAALAICAGWMPFQLIFVQFGLPRLNSRIQMFAVISNLVLNLSLIGWLGIEGAALGTALSLILTTALFVFVFRKVVRQNFTPKDAHV